MTDFKAFVIGCGLLLLSAVGVLGQDMSDCPVTISPAESIVMPPGRGNQYTNGRAFLFGDARLVASEEPNAIEPTATSAPPTVTLVLLEVSAQNNVNVRAEPSTQAAVVRTLSSTALADGRNASGDWLHIRFEDGVTGWVFVQIVTVSGSIDTLPILPAEGSVSETPSTTIVAPSGPIAFFFESGQERTCANNWADGVHIQAPRGHGNLEMTINGVKILLQGLVGTPGTDGNMVYTGVGFGDVLLTTLFVQAAPNGDMVINVVEGRAWVTAAGATVIVPAGARTRVPLDENLAAAGAPNGLEPYDSAQFDFIGWHYEPPQSPEALAAFAHRPLPGDNLWRIDGQISGTGNHQICTTYDGGFSSRQARILSEDVRLVFDLPYAEFGDKIMLMLPVGGISLIGMPHQETGASIVPTISADGTYVINDRDPTSTWEQSVEFTVVSPLHIVGSTTTTTSSTAEGVVIQCTMTANYTLDFIERRD